MAPAWHQSLQHSERGDLCPLGGLAALTAPSPCTACEEPDPQVSYTFAGGSVIVRLHAACEAIWQQERHTS